MKNDTRNRISYWHASTSVRGGVLLCFITQLGLTPIFAFADVGLPPPAVHQTTNNGFPSSQALKNQGYDPSTGVLRVDERNRGTSTVTKTGDSITGQQQKTVTATGNYGEKGTMSTAATQKTSVSKLSTIANAAVIGSIAGQNQTQNANKLGSQIAQGDFSGAASTAVDMAGQALNNMLGGLPNGIAEGYSGMAELRKAADNFNKEMYGGSSSQQASQLGQVAQQAAAQQAQAERKGDLAGAIGQAAAAKAATAAQQEAQKQDMHEDVIWVAGGYQGHPKYGMTPEEACSGDVPGMAGVTFLYTSSGSCLATDGINRWLWGVSKQVYKYKPSETFTQDATLNSNDIQKILERMLQSQQTNHKELMEQLAKMGDTVEQATTSKEFTPSVAYSDPYTPAGSDTPQQTRFEIDKNGNITTSTVSRPDLKPNSSQAPTRTVVIPNKAETGQQTGQKETGENTTPTTGETGQQTPTTGQTGQQTPTTGQTGQTNQQNQQQKEFCEKNPSSAACAELGEADYEDLSIPESNIDLKLQPMDIFSTDGTCPANPTFSIGALGTFEIPYQYLCDVARLIRPILILSTIIGCGFFAYSAVREL